MKTRIEVWVDTEISVSLINDLRQKVEDAVWDGINDFRVNNPGCLRSIMVQANEVPSPL